MVNIQYKLNAVLFLQCNKKRIMDYPNLWDYARDIYQHDGIGKSTVDMEYSKISYMVTSLLMLYCALYLEIHVEIKVPMN